MCGKVSNSPVSVAVRSKALSNIKILGSNFTGGMDVCVRLFYVVLCVGSGLAMGWSPVQGVLPNVYQINKLKERPRLNKRAVEHKKEGEECPITASQLLYRYKQNMKEECPTTDSQLFYRYKRNVKQRCITDWENNEVLKGCIQHTT
jgi:hypothetical protein